MKYDYYEAAVKDVSDFIRDNNYDLSEFSGMDEFFDQVYNDCSVEDSVTGNASGSYTFSRYKAKENVVSNIDMLGDVIRYFDYSSKDLGDMILNDDWETLDVLFRCYVLGDAVDLAIKKYIAELGGEDVVFKESGDWEIIN